MLECVINVSEGRDSARVTRIAATAGDLLLDVHRDAHHNRCVITVVGEEAPRAIATEAVATLDLRAHAGVHPRIGVVDVVPFIALAGATPADACAARDRFASWMADALGVPCFLYGPDRTLPEVRRGAFDRFGPDAGPTAPHPRAGATAVGCRGALVAFNVWLEHAEPADARAIARLVRGPQVRALGLEVGERCQVSMNLVAPGEVGPAAAFDAVRVAADAAGVAVAGAELVGLIPAAVLAAVPRARWPELDLDADRTVEARLAARGLG